ncbi:protein REVERSION-TO-ETHYLENE SENSITIVITY1-like protein [Leptotrombidium deliense]|uniref:Protein REVERSION-TO-ETHYLENE SENSITIVITY1-like protein n=1 Tax=Leptotrombidium deliense TaxID=299467 RepID=A0A443S9H4_9ACAR|nr:protein REVERSION-TO-ETHYLENE SENSITIVITY1-like protein [Leptotrombidium deliense]
MVVDSGDEEEAVVKTMEKIDVQRVRYPYFFISSNFVRNSWIFPFVGHTGIGMSDGVIRDFAGPYLVTEDNMAFGNPTKYIQMEINKVEGGQQAWDRAVKDASDVYEGRMVT